MKINREANEYPKKSKFEPTEKREGNIEPYLIDSQGKQLTTDTGVKINDTDNSLRAGIRGPP